MNLEQDSDGYLSLSNFKDIDNEDIHLEDSR